MRFPLVVVAVVVVVVFVVAVGEIVLAAVLWIVIAIPKRQIFFPGLQFFCLSF